MQAERIGLVQMNDERDSDVDVVPVESRLRAGVYLAVTIRYIDHNDAAWLLEWLRAEEFLRRLHPCRIQSQVCGLRGMLHLVVVCEVIWEPHKARVGAVVCRELDIWEAVRHQTVKEGHLQLRSKFVGARICWW